MAALGNDVNYQELNFVFKSLAEQGSEAQLMKEHNEYVSGHFLEYVSEFLSEKTENCIMMRPYGSAAEDLKCLAPDDYGDVDVMVFPNAEKCFIYEELLEYSSENPLHVKIKGSDQPIFQSCLVEGTEYVATTAVKKFNPAIYGTGAPELLYLLTSSMKAMSREDLALSPECIFSWKNKDSSPAFTIDLKQSFETQNDELQKLIDTQSWYNLDVAELECLFNAMNCTSRGIKYTREHAEAFDDYIQSMREVLKAWVTKGSPSGMIQNFPGLFQEICSGDATENFKARVQAIESRLQNESGSGMSGAVCLGEQSVTPEKRGEDEAGSSMEPPNDEPFVAPENCDDTQRSSEDSEDHDESNVEVKKLTEKAEMSSEDASHNEDGNADEDEKRKKARIAANKRFMEHTFGIGTEMKGHNEKSKEYKRKVGIDLVPALRSRGWPKVAREWIKRDRKWPSPEMVDKVLQEGFHLVVKPPKTNGNPDSDFRISFSHAEYLLSQEMNDIQRECYRCLKKYYRAYLSKPTGLVTFHLKNLLLQTIEETGAEMWTESNRAECMMKLLGNLLEALTKKNLPHFFVRAYNLFSVDYIEDPKTLEYLAREVEKIVESPMEYSNKLIQNERDLMQVLKEECVPSSEPTKPVKPISEHGREGAEKTARSGDNDDIQSKEEILTSPVLQTETTQQSRPTASYRYHDLEDIYLQVSQELIDMAVNDADCNLESLDPLERSLVEELRELASIHGRELSDGFLKMLRTGWGSQAYYKVYLSNEPDMRRRMLVAIQGQVELWKYALRQEDFGPGNEEAIFCRMTDPTADNPFDLNNVFPAGGAVQCLSRLLNSLTLQPAQPQMVNMDDIPLD